MADIIQLLPDAIANQIAAGEVVQRPASVVKELLENAIDAGATKIQLVVKDAGRTLIQVIDNGSGMSETDARMCWERHATSKIRASTDLFAIQTMGFRGEALASMAAVAQVEMKTRLHQQDTGTRIAIEDSRILAHEPCSCPAGTQISVKNLFYNVPARRNFLKSNTIELRHINDEFIRVAMAYPDIHFSLTHNGNELFHLPEGNLRQRIVSILGKDFNKRLVPLNEETDIVEINGFIGKPEFSKKVRGEQYFFVNHRFIRSAYLHSAVAAGFEELISKDMFPSYFIFIKIDPSHIDINVHPTKQEIKFDDERLIYHYLKVAVRYALGVNSVSPMLDFEQDPSFMEMSQKKPIEIPPAEKFSPIISTNAPPASFVSKLNKPNFPDVQLSKQEQNRLATNNLNHWQTLYEGLEDTENAAPPTTPTVTTVRSKLTANPAPIDDDAQTFSKTHKPPYQIHQQYIISHIKSGFLLIDQQAAHERILYERYMAAFGKNNTATQQQLFAITVTVSSADAEIFKTMLPEINAMGFDIGELGKDTFVIQGAPTEMGDWKPQEIVEKLIAQAKEEVELSINLKERMARTLARQKSIKRGKELSITEMQQIIDELFACEIPYKSPFGQLCFITNELSNLEKQFNGK
jgi:DNA mismatch repair protein MutL